MSIGNDRRTSRNFTFRQHSGFPKKSFFMKKRAIQSGLKNYYNEKSYSIEQYLTNASRRSCVSFKSTSPAIFLKKNSFKIKNLYPKPFAGST